MTTEIFDSISADTLVQIIQEAGFRARLEVVDVNGKSTKRIAFSASGIECYVGLYGRAREEGILREITIWCSVTTNVDLDAVNEWNKTSPSTRAFCSDKGTVFLDHYLALYGGVLRPAIREFFATYDTLLGEAILFFKARRRTGSATENNAERATIDYEKLKKLH